MAEEPLSLVRSLAKLDMMLTERINVPIRYLSDDYTGIAGADGTAATETDCELNYRLLATSWIGPWGSVLPWLLPASTKGNTYSLSLPQSRVRHFLSDASLYAKIDSDGSLPLPRICRAVLRLGPSETLQLLDSEFACNIALLFKQGHCYKDTVTYNEQEKTITMKCPLFFQMPLKVLPLYIPNTPLPEIEYDVTTAGKGKLSAVHFFTEIISSPGEADISSMSETPAKLTSIVQHLPCLTTFRSPCLEGGVSTVTVPAHMTDKLVRALYLRVVEEGGSNDDVDNAVASIDIVGPPPNSHSLLGMPLPGSLCRTHLKTRFSSQGLPYYVIPFTTNPTGNVADYGAVMSEGTEVRISLHPQQQRVQIEICLETFNRVVWRR